MDGSQQGGAIGDLFIEGVHGGEHNNERQQRRRSPHRLQLNPAHEKETDDEQQREKGKKAQAYAQRTPGSGLVRANFGPGWRLSVEIPQAQEEFLAAQSDEQQPKNYDGC